MSLTNNEIMEKITRIGIDIETIPSNPVYVYPPQPLQKDVKTRVKTDPDKVEAEQKEKYPAILKKWEEECAVIKTKTDKECSLNPLKGRILCIGYCIDDEEEQCIQYVSEEKMLNKIAAIIEKTNMYFTLYAHNGKAFDFSWIAHKAFKYRIKSLMKYFIRLNKHDERFEDTAEIAKMFNYTSYYKFDDLCKHYGIPSPKTKMDGSMVYPYYKEGRMNEIVEYCKADVRSLRLLHKLYTGW